MLKKALIAYLLIGLPFFSLVHAQIITITDLNTATPLEFVTLVSTNPEAYAITNETGQADLSAFHGSPIIEVRLLGYETTKTSYLELEASGFRLTLEPAGLQLDQLVVSATRWRQSSDQTPAGMATISSREAALQNPQTAADLLGVSGKVFIQKSQQGGGSPMIRGFATNRLLYAVDGIRMNTAIFRSGNIQNVINLDPFAIEQTDVIFGPGSLLYGSDAIGGVMRFQTLTPRLGDDSTPLVSGKMNTRYSSANQEKTGHLDVHVGWEKWAMVTSLTSWHYDHLRQGSNGPDDYVKPYYVQRQADQDRVIYQEDPLLQVPSAYDQANFMQKIRFAPNANWDIQYGFHFSETSPYGRYDRHSRVRNGLPRYAEWDYGPQRWMMNALQVSSIRQKGVYDEAVLRLAYQQFKESRIDRTLNRTARNTQAEGVDAYSANLDFQRAVGTKHTLYYGAEYVWNGVESTGLLTDISTQTSVEGPARYPQSQWSSYAAYVDESFRVNEKLSLQGGVRFGGVQLDATFNTAFFDLPFTTAALHDAQLTGSVGAVYRPMKNLVLSTNVGTAFRAPNVDDMGKIFDSEPGTVTVPNPNLKSEKATNLDLGVATVLGNRLKIDLTGFYTVLQNALVRRNFQLNGKDSILYDGQLSQVQAVQNAAQATVYGLQAGLELKMPRHFHFSADINYQVGEEELDDGSKSPSRHAAPLFGVARLGYTQRKVDMQWSVQYQAEKTYQEMPQEERSKDEIYAKDAEGRNYAPAWYTVNFKALYTLSPVWKLSAGVENITDQRYRPFSSGISGAGRNVLFGVSAVF